MATDDSTLSNTQGNLSDARDKLDEVIALAYFVQSISLIPGTAAITLQPKQLTGFYYVLKNAIDGMNEVGALIDAVRAQPEEVNHA